jgi:pyridoxine 5-phosphate synthase
MVRLSVNVNKIATLRNARGGREPSVIRAVETVIDAGAPGVTVHPRADERHIRRADVIDVSALLRERWQRGGRPVEFNVEGDPRLDLMDLVVELRPDQCTLVPVQPGEVTSQAGWSMRSADTELPAVVARLRDAGVRVSLFVEPDPVVVEWAARLGADRVEFYTEPFASAFEENRDAGQTSFDRYARAARLAHDLGLGVNAGHDLHLDNLAVFRHLPHLAEVSIGHALVSHALWVGLDRAVRDYLAVLRDN